MTRTTTVAPTNTKSALLRRISRWPKLDLVHAVIGQASLDANFLPNGLKRTRKEVLVTLYLGMAKNDVNPKEVRSRDKEKLINAIKGAMTIGSLKEGLLKLTNHQLRFLYVNMR